MKTATANHQTHIAGVSTSEAVIWQITRTDNTTKRYTSHVSALSVGGNTYTAAVVDAPQAVQNAADLSVKGTEVLAFIDAADLDETDLLKGLYDYAMIQLATVNFEAPADDEIKVMRGWFGKVQIFDNETFGVELRNLHQALDQQFMEEYSPECRANLGDDRCMVPIDPAIVIISTAYAVGDFMKVSTGGGTFYEVYENRIYECTIAGTTSGTPPTYDTVVGNTTVDGTVTWTAVEAWSRDAVVAGVTDNKTFTITVTESRDVDDWFNIGSVIFDDGLNAGLAREIKDWINSSGEITFHLEAPFTIAVSDKLHLFPGCSKGFDVAGGCIGRFDNHENFRGHPHIPGMDKLVQYESR